MIKKFLNFLKEYWLMLVLIGVIVGGSVYYIFLHPYLRVKHAPKFVKAYVVVKVKNLDYATNDFMVIEENQNPELQACIVAKKWGEDKLTYFCPSKKLKIDGKFIPEDQIEQWDNYKWKEVRVFWFKIQPVMLDKYSNEPFEYSHVKYAYSFQHTWPLTWTHKLDVRDFASIYPKQNYGTMRFKIRAEIKQGLANVIEKVYSPGEEDVDENNIISDRVFKVALVPEKDYFGHITSLFNLAYAEKGIDYKKFGEKNPAYLRIAIDSPGYFTYAAQLSGFKDVELGSISSLLKHFHPVMEGIHLDEKKGIYLDSKGKPVEISKLKRGYIVWDGELLGVYASEGSLEAGKYGVLSEDDRVLYSNGLPVYYEKMGDHFYKNISIGYLE